MNPGLSDHWRALYQLGQWAGFKQYDIITEGENFRVFIVNFVFDGLHEFILSRLPFYIGQSHWELFDCIRRYRAIWNFLYPPLSEGQFWRRFFHHLVCRKFLQSLGEDNGDPVRHRLTLWKNLSIFVFGWTSFFIWTVCAAHSLKSVFDRIPACSSLSNSLLICSRAAKGTFRFFYNIGCAPSFTLSLALNFKNFPRLPEKKWGNRCLNSFLRFTELDVELSILRQKVLIGESHRLIFSIQCVPNKLSEFFST